MKQRPSLPSLSAVTSMLAPLVVAVIAAPSPKAWMALMVFIKSRMIDIPPNQGRGEENSEKPPALYSVKTASQRLAVDFQEVTRLRKRGVAAETVVAEVANGVLVGIAFLKDLDAHRFANDQRVGRLPVAEADGEGVGRDLWHVGHLVVGIAQQLARDFIAHRPPQRAVLAVGQLGRASCR